MSLKTVALFEYGLALLIAFCLGAAAYTAHAKGYDAAAFIFCMALFIWVALCIPDDVPLVSQADPDEE